MGLSVFPAPSTAVASGSQTFNSSSTWTAPAGVTAVDYIIAAGGGGGGAACNPTTNANYTFGTGGGSGGEVVRGTLSVIPGTTYPITVGAGGSGGTTTSTAITSSAAAGGYSGLALNLSTENAILNGAFEIQSNDAWLAGFSQSTGFPYYDSAYPAAYNGQPSLSNIGYNNQRTGGTNIPNVSDANNLKRYSYANSNQAYHDLQRFINVTPNTAYVLSGWTSVHNQGNPSQVAIAIDYYTSPNAVGRVGGDQTSFVSVDSSNTVWTRISLNTTSPSGANFAVVRFANNNNYSSAQMAWTGMQLESGSTLTDYVGLNTSGYKTVAGLGIITVNAGAIAVGGGGGSSSQSGSEVKGVGFGGGGTTNQASTYNMGGNGSGQGGGLGNITLFASSTSAPYMSAIYTVSNGNGGIPSGGHAYALNTTNAGYLFQQNGAPATSEGLGAGGMGSRGGSIIPGLSGVGAGPSVSSSSVGSNANPNTGAGGGGGMVSASGSASGFNGGNGGSGKVILSW